MSEFENNIRSIFEKHGIENKELELVLGDLFEDFKTHLIHDRKFNDSIQQNLDRELKRITRFR